MDSIYLTDVHKLAHVNSWKLLFFQPHRKEFLENLLTEDDSRVPYDNVARNAVWLPRNAGSQTQSKPNYHQRKHLVCICWDAEEPTENELFSANNTITSSVYVDQLQKLADAIYEKWSRRSFIRLLHNNARPLAASRTRQKVEILG